MSDEPSHGHDDTHRTGWVAIRTNTHGELQWSISVPFKASADDMNQTVDTALEIAHRMDQEIGRPSPKPLRR